MNQSSDPFAPEADNETAPLFAVDLRQLSAAQFAGLGVSRMAYVKPVLINGSRAFAIHGADGTAMAVAGDEAVALAAIAQHEMTPARVH